MAHNFRCLRALYVHKRLRKLSAKADDPERISTLAELLPVVEVNIFINSNVEKRCYSHVQLLGNPIAGTMLHNLLC
jgi:hypothetical protein